MRRRGSEKHPTIVGVDLHSGSPRSIRRARYSLVVAKGGEIVLEEREVGLKDVISLLERLKECTLATDNIFELARDPSSLRRLMLRLPEGVKVIQVSGTQPGGPAKVRELAAMEGIEVPPKPDSLAEARILAELAKRGHGCELLAFEPECRIVITKNNSIKRGGSGTNRWRRMIEANILTEAKRISSLLQNGGIDYDLYTEKGEGGLKRAELVVYAPKGVVSRAIRPSTRGPLKILIFRRMKEKIEFVGKPRKVKKRPIIVSIDPGTSMGLAILDLHGGLLELKTLRRPSRSQVIEEITKQGRPLLITTDVSPIPKRVKEIAHTFSTKAETPAKPLNLREKRRLVQEYEERTGVRASSSHERDSLAAVLEAYKRLSTLFAKAKARAKEKGLPFSTRTREMLIKGRSISEALERSSPRTGDRIPRKRHKASPAASSKRSTPVNSKKKIREFEAEIEKLRKALREKEGEMEGLRDKISELERERAIELERDRRIAHRDLRIRQLERLLSEEKRRIDSLLSQVERLESAIRDPPKGWAQLVLVKSLSRAGLEEAMSSGRVRDGDVVLTMDSSGAGRSTVGLLSELGVRAIIWKENGPSSEIKEELERRGIKVIDGRATDVWWRGGAPYASEELIMGKVCGETEKEKGRKLRSILEKYRSKIGGRIQEENNV